MSLRLQCSTSPRINQPGAQKVIECIETETSPEEFDKICQSYPSYRLSYGNNHQETALKVSLRYCNFPLALHIIQKGGAEIANQEDKDGFPPLFWNCFKKNALQTQTIRIVKALVDVGADINCITKPYASLFPMTPLWFALEKGYNLTYMIFLLKKGAFFYPHLTERGKEFLNAARLARRIMDCKQKQISDLKEELRNRKTQDTFYSYLPLDLTRKFFEYLHPNYDPTAVFDKDDQLLIRYIGDLYMELEKYNPARSDSDEENSDFATKHDIIALNRTFEQNMNICLTIYTNLKSLLNPRYPEIFDLTIDSWEIDIRQVLSLRELVRSREIDKKKQEQTEE